MKCDITVGNRTDGDFVEYTNSVLIDWLLVVEVFILCDWLRKKRTRLYACLFISIISVSHSTAGLTVAQICMLQKLSAGEASSHDEAKRAISK